MEHSKDIICPDCNLNEISTKQFEKYGRCMGCYRRELVSKTHNRPYVKFIDLPKEEQDRILALRDKNSKSRYNRINNKKPVQTKSNTKQCTRASYVDNSILHNFLSNSQNLTMNEILDYVKKYIPGCEGITSTYLRTLMSRGNYKYKKAVPTSINNKEGKLTVNIRCTVYTQEVMNALNTMVTKDMYIADIYQTLINMFPDNGITPSNLATKLKRLNIPYKHGRKSIYKTEQYNKIKEPVLEVNNEYTIPQGENINTQEDSNEINHCINKEDINDEVELRLQPIREEVEDTLQKQFTQLNCTLEKNYSTQDYIQMLEMLEYLILNKDNIIKVRTNQHDVANAYQQDALHEMENSLAKPGDTYLSDKMHVVRDIRRYYEYDCKDVTILRGLINRIDIKNVQYTKRALLDQVEKREEILYIPMVDMKLIDKHDWATDTINDSPAYKKRILYRNAEGPITKYENTTTPETGDSTKGRKFRVSCKLSGGGYGVFQPWYKDYTTNTRDLALSLAKGELAQLAHTYPGIIYTELNVLEINAK